LRQHKVKRSLLKYIHPSPIPSEIDGKSTTYGDGGAHRKDFDADPSPSLFLSGVGESPGQGWVDKRQVAGKQSSESKAQR